MEARLNERYATDIRLVEAELLRLDETRREAVMNRLVMGSPLPIVLAGDEVIHAGELELEPVSAAIGRLLGGGSSDDPGTSETAP